MTKIILEYVWLDNDDNFRSKIKVVNDTSIFPSWNYDGSSTGQATDENTEIILKPIYSCNNPFFKTKSFIVLCETFDSKGKPLNNNYRFINKKIFDDALKFKPWFGFEQEYFILDSKTNLPANIKKTTVNGEHYCAVGNAIGRNIMTEHLEKCLTAELDICGTNAEVVLGQWEYQIGPVLGINACDQLLVSRFILTRIAENNNIKISFHPKPLLIFNEKLNGSGCHTNFSTELMRHGDNNKTGMDYIISCIARLKETFKETKLIYGKNNNERMTGECETADLNTFTYGIGTRNTSIRIGNLTSHNNKGYFEDRRPASNMNPYLVASYLLKNIL